MRKWYSGGNGCLVDWPPAWLPTAVTYPLSFCMSSCRVVCFVVAVSCLSLVWSSLGIFSWSNGEWCSMPAKVVAHRPLSVCCGALGWGTGGEGHVYARATVWSAPGGLTRTTLRCVRSPPPSVFPVVSVCACRGFGSQAPLCVVAPLARALAESCLSVPES